MAAVIDRVGQVWMFRLGFEEFPGLVLYLEGRSTWAIQNLTRVGRAREVGTIHSAQFGVEEGVFTEFESRDKGLLGLQKGELFFLSGVTNILRERIA